MNVEKFLHKAIATASANRKRRAFASAEDGLSVPSGAPRYESVFRQKPNLYPAGCCNPDFGKPLTRAYINLTCSHNIPRFFPCTKCGRTKRQADKLKEIFTEKLALLGNLIKEK